MSSLDLVPLNLLGILQTRVPMRIWSAQPLEAALPTGARKTLKTDWQDKATPKHPLHSWQGPEAAGEGLRGLGFQLCSPAV